MNQQDLLIVSVLAMAVFAEPVINMFLEAVL